MSYKIQIELQSRRLFLKQDGRIINTYPVAIGKPSTPTPTGDYHIIDRVKNPGGVLGTRWLRFTYRQHGIHGTNQPQSIGQAVSLGCVRMYNNDVEELYDKVPDGTPIIIRNSFSGNPGNSTGNNPGKPGNSDRDDGSYTIHTVQRGESLWVISRKYNVTITDIKRINNLSSDLIHPGQELKIPKQ
ncbi:L,D-transpeptidase family protein [Natronospora cellulosivora (SeqCode)]